MTGGPWYNISICKKLHGKVFEGFIRNAKLTDIILCVLLMHMKNIINHLVMMAASVGVVHYHKIQQQNYYIGSVQP